MNLLRELWTKPFGEYQDKNIRLLAFITGIVIHIAVITLVVILSHYNIPPRTDETSSPELGGMSGGGGGDSREIVLEFGPSPGDEDATTNDNKNMRFRLIKNLVIKHPSVEGKPVIEQKKPDKKQKYKPVKKPMGSSLATNMPKRHIRGSGPGSGGGTGGGKGGGIGTGTGYSIDWGGKGTRQLISGRLPRYPDGTNKEMPVTLRFTVLPNGIVAKVVPIRRGDEILEKEAISALETWRFDPLPTESDQQVIYGTVTFNFKLESSVSRE